MTSKNSVLLTIKQYNSITPNELFARIVGNYSNSNSARAALSRTLKNLAALGFIRKHEGFLQLTDKGLAELHKEMKNKLILRLNETIIDEHNHDLDSIVKLLTTLIERGKTDADLLKVSKDSCTFYVSDLEEMIAKLSKDVEHINYLSSVLTKHVAALKELDFPHEIEMQMTEESLNKLSRFFEKENAQELLIECDDMIKPILQEEFRAELKNQQLFVSKQNFSKLINFFKGLIAQNIKSKEKIKIIFSGISVYIIENTIVFTGPYGKLGFLIART